MITIHEKTAQTFNTLGLGALLPSSCVVTEELNGAFELELEHPYDADSKWKRIEEGRIIYASTPRGRQPFRIYRTRPDMNGITVNARHIFYDLLDNQCNSISYSGTAVGALQSIQGAFAYAMPFTFTTNISTSGTLSTGRMNPIQALLSDDDDTTSFVKGFGGEVLRDGFNVSIKTSIGKDRDVAIRYGKNLIGLEVTQDESDIKTRIQCYGKNGSATVDSPYLGAYLYPKIHILEDENKTVSELREEAQALLDGGIDIPIVNIKVDFIPLSKTVEYKNYAVLEEVQLGDIVTVIHNKMNFSKRARVISYEWDCLLEQYNEVELGDFMPTLASSVTSGVRSGNLASAAAVGASAVSAALQAHLNDFSNPHHVSVDQTGGGTGTGDMLASIYDPNGRKKDIFAHETDKNNPHGVTPYQIGAASNPNLLDNWYFADPINQRGKTEYTAGNYNGIYTIDRWQLGYNGARLSVVDGGVKLYYGVGGAVQMNTVIEPKMLLPNTTYTLTLQYEKADVTNDNMKVDIFCNGERLKLIMNPTEEGVTFKTPSSISSFGFYIIALSGTDNAEALTLYAAKLEMGDKQTLLRQENGTWVLNDAPPNKASELAKCKAYYMKTQQPAFVYYVTANEAYVSLRVPTCMRTGKPSITILTGKIGNLRDVWEWSITYAGEYVATLCGTYASHGVAVNSNADITAEFNAEL